MALTPNETKAFRSSGLTSAIASAISGTSNASNGVSTISQAADSSYNQVQMQQVLTKLDELILALRR